MLAKILRLHMLDVLREDMGYYLTYDLISHALARNIVQECDNAVRDLVPHINDLIEIMGLPKIPEIYAPMTRDWSKFNEQTDWDDNVSPGAIFQMHKM